MFRRLRTVQWSKESCDLLDQIVGYQVETVNFTSQKQFMENMSEFFININTFFMTSLDMVSFVEVSI